MHTLVLTTVTLHTRSKEIMGAPELTSGSHDRDLTPLLLLGAWRYGGFSRSTCVVVQETPRHSTASCTDQ